MCGEHEPYNFQSWSSRQLFFWLAKFWHVTSQTFTEGRSSKIETLGTLKYNAELHYTTSVGKLKILDH